MYSSPHAAVGFTVITTFKDNLAVGIPLAIVSHFIMDHIDEKGLTMKDAIIHDLVPGLITIFLSFLTPMFWFYMLAWVCGNLFDIIDKKMYLGIFFPEKFKVTRWFHFQKQIISPTPVVTKAIGWVSVAIVSLLLFE